MGILANENAIETGGYNIANSLRFQSASSQYLNRTPASAGNRRIWTWSGWVKRGSLTEGYLFTTSQPTNNLTFIYFTSSNTIQFWTYQDVLGTTFQVDTSAVLRDPAAWYHVVVVLDTTQATSTNRIKIYINGVQQTLTGTYPATQNYDAFINTTNAHYIGKHSSSAIYYDGYMTEVNFIDGQALTPSSFGETNTLTGQWVAKKYTGTYGTNGFYLPFSNGTSTTTLGYDSSGNSNNWTLNNFTRSAGVSDCWMYDVPSGNGSAVGGTQPNSNYAVMNPLNQAGTATPTLANLRVTQSTNFAQVASSIGVSSGKWYYEHTITAVGGENSVGIGTAPLSTGIVGVGSQQYGYYSNGNKYNNNTGSAYGSSFTTGDVIGVAYDADAGSLTFYKNNVSQGVAFTSITGTMFALAATRTTGGNNISDFNFGQRSFAYTPPSGFKALCTANLPTSSIVKGNQYMDATLYTGNSSAISVVNSGGFQPDLVWVKGRNTTQWHGLYNSISGVGKYLVSNSTNAEATYADTLTSFNSNGFSAGNDSSGSGINTTGINYVAWQWDAGSSTVTNTNGTISSQVRANTTAGVSVVTFTGTGANATVGHGLGVAPSMIITKNRSAATNWITYHKSIGATGCVILDGTNATITNSIYWNNTAPTSSVFSIGTNVSSNNQVAYCFAEIAGFSKFGSYTGNGSTDGVFIFTGFKPKYVMTKAYSSAGYNWNTYDSARSPSNANSNVLSPSTSGAEETGFDPIDLLSNGFKLRMGNRGSNVSGVSYIFMAFAENPFAQSNAV